MTVAPWAEEAEKVRPIFRELAELKKQCEEILGAPLPHLSMGMSNDFEVAVEEGATMSTDWQRPVGRANEGCGPNKQ